MLPNGSHLVISVCWGTVNSAAGTSCKTRGHGIAAVVILACSSFRGKYGVRQMMPGDPRGVVSY